MATQAERREATRTAILAAARDKFGGNGFAETSVDAIAEAAGVAKGAVYHHFPSKEALFEAVAEETSRDVSRRVNAAARHAPDALAALAAGIRAYFSLCAEETTAQLLLRDAPAVLGWERWREIDVEHFGGGVLRALEAAMRAGLIAEQPLEPLVRLVLGATTEAGIACAGRKDLAAAADEYATALGRLLEALRI